MMLGAACARIDADPKAGPQSAPVRWTPVGISTPAYESSAVFAAGGREMYFMRADQDFDNYRIFRSECRESGWSVPEEPHFSAAPGVHDADPFVTYDGSRLYFISTRHRYEEVGNEDFDIFFVERTAAGGWGEAARLPEPVNSRGSELLPRMSRSGALYFGSSRDGGKGGSDIYVARLQASGEWVVTNVADVNTPADDFEADVSPDEQRLAVVSDREGRSRIHLYDKQGEGWAPTGRVEAREAVFQVGPLWSPDGRRLLFSQDAGEDSGEIFLIQTDDDPDPRWPPVCGSPAAAAVADDPVTPGR